MDAARKTGKRQAAGRGRLKDGDESTATGVGTVAADRASHLRVDAEYAGQRLENFLLRIARGVPKSHVYRIVRSGEVRVNKARVTADYRVQAGDDIRVPPMRTARPGDAPAPAFAPAQMPPILFEDEFLIIRAVGRAAILETVRTGSSGIGRGERILKV